MLVAKRSVAKFYIGLTRTFMFHILSNDAAAAYCVALGLLSFVCIPNFRILRLRTFPDVACVWTNASLAESLPAILVLTMMRFVYAIVLLAAAAVKTTKCARILPTVAHSTTLDVKLCTAFGFKSKSGLCIYDSLFKNDAVPNDIVVFKAETDGEIFRLKGGGDVYVTYLSVLEKNSGAGLLLQRIGAYVRGLCEVESAESILLVLVEGKENENGLLEKQILQITEEAQSYKCDVQVKSSVMLIDLYIRPALSNSCTCTHA